MANKYLNLFYQQIQQKQPFIYAMTTIVEHYSEDYWACLEGSKVKDEICLALEKFYNMLFDFVDAKKILNESVSLAIINYKFNTAMPQDFMEFFEAAKEHERSFLLELTQKRESILKALQKQEIEYLIEISKERAPSELVANCENKAAAEAFSPEVIFAQTAILEKALIHKKIIRQSHIQETEAKIVEWIFLLYQKFAEVILESTSLDQLDVLIAQKFNEELTLDLIQLKAFKEEINSQIEYFKGKDFFKQYYVKTQLADKYDFVYDFYRDLKTRSAMTSELKMTLSGLFFGIVAKAYQPMDAKKFALMKLRNGTVENVFNGVRAWMKKNYSAFNEKDLYCELVGKLQQEEETFKVWQEVSHRISDVPALRTYQPLMRNLDAMKYAGDPNQDPRDLLAELPKPGAFPHSPVKSKQNVKPMHALNCTEEETRRLINIKKIL